jgi:hypothetical protein
MTKPSEDPQLRRVAATVRWTIDTDTEPLSLVPLAPDEALRALLATLPPEPAVALLAAIDEDWEDD